MIEFTSSYFKIKSEWPKLKHIMGRCKAEKRHPKRKENKGGIIGSFEGKRLRKKIKMQSLHYNMDLQITS